MGMHKIKEWMAYDQLDPFGQDREDFRMGMLCAAMLNPHRKKDAKAFKPSDFMPKFGERFFRDEPDAAVMPVDKQVMYGFGLLAAFMK